MRAITTATDHALDTIRAVFTLNLHRISKKKLRVVFASTLSARSSHNGTRSALRHPL